MTIKTIKEEWATIPNKIAVVIMAFKGDDSCLKQCLRGLEEQIKKGYNLEIHILIKSIITERLSSTVTRILMECLVLLECLLRCLE